MHLANNAQRDCFGRRRTDIDTHRATNPETQLFSDAAELLIEFGAARCGPEKAYEMRKSCLC